jgi:hypothetical protein
MKCCIDFTKRSKILDKVDEITIEYHNNMVDLFEFLEKYPDKRVNIFILNDKDISEIDIKNFASIKEKYNVYLKLVKYNKSLVNTVVENNIPFFFNNNISDIDTFNGYVHLGVSDIYVAEDLCFQLDKLAEVAHEAGIALRTYANICQTRWKEMDSLKTFFIRPEDLEFYEDYLDTIEFITKEDKDIDIFYEIYFVDKKWFGKLNEIIIGFDSEIDSRFILPKFAERRIKCNKNCMKNGKCRMCEVIDELAETLKDKGIMPKIEKKEEEVDNG